MQHLTPFLQALSQHFGQRLHMADESQTYTLTVDEEEIFLRYLPEDDAWAYFGFVTDFMAEVSQEQLEKALELNVFGRGTADFYLGLMGQALVLSGKLSIMRSSPEALVEALIQLSQQLSPLHQLLTATTTEEKEAEESVALETPNYWKDSFIQV